jgi:hypothetical protein
MKQRAEATARFMELVGIIPKTLCSANITHDMIGDLRFWRLLAGVKTVVVGRRANESAPLLKKRRVCVVEAITIKKIQKSRW